MSASYPACKHTKRPIPDITVNQEVAEHIGKEFRTLPIFEKGLFEHTYTKHYSLETNEYLRCRWLEYKRHIESRVFAPFQFPDIRSCDNIRAVFPLTKQSPRARRVVYYKNDTGRDENVDEMGMYTRWQWGRFGTGMWTRWDWRRNGNWDEVNLSGRICHLHIRDYHFYICRNRLIPSESFHTKKDFRFKLKPGPGVDFRGQMPIPQEHLMQRGHASQRKMPKRYDKKTAEDEEKKEIK